MDYFELMKKRLETRGIISTTELDSRDLDSFSLAMRQAYNKEVVYIDDSLESTEVLIYQNSASPEIRKKIIAAFNEDNCKPGSIIHWNRLDSYWIIDRQNESKSAYFQGSMLESLFELKWRDLEKDITYSQRVAVKGPEETTIKSETINDTFVDTQTGSLKLIIPSETEGVSLLSRYVEVMLNNRKYEIQVVDDITDKGLVTIELLEIPITIENDDKENNIVDGLIAVDFECFSNLEDIETLEVGAIIELNSVLFRNGNIVNSDYTISATNATISDDYITFDSVAESTIEIYYSEFNKTFTYTIDILLGDVTMMEVFKILGNETINTFLNYTYEFRELLNGVEITSSGTWEYDTDYLTLINTDVNTITLEAGQKTGDTIITYSVNGVDYTKNIKITTIFERSN